MNIPSELKQQIEAAYDYRGYVTVTLKDGTLVEGFLFNRQYTNPKLSQDNFIDIILKNKDRKLRLPVTRVLSIALTGEDCAAGKSYADYQAKQKDAENKP